MSTTRPSTSSAPNPPAGPSNSSVTRGYVGNPPRGVCVARSTRTSRRSPTPPLEGRLVVGKDLPRPFIQNARPSGSFIGTPPPFSRAVLRLDSDSEEEIDGPSYVGNSRLLRRKRRIIEVLSSDDEDAAKPLSARSLSPVVPSPSPAPPEDSTSETPELPDLSYVPEDDEVPEDGELEVYGETVPDDVEDEDEIPMRVLTDFTIYELSRRRKLVQFDPTLCEQKGSKFTASGIVEAYSEPDDDDSSESSTARPTQRVALTEILEVNIHTVNDDKSFDLDPKVYIRTAHAWYILDVPSDDYKPFYSAFAVAQSIFHELITSAHEDKYMTYQDFVEHMESVDDIFTDITEADIQKEYTRIYLVSAFEDLREECQDSRPRLCARLLKVPAVAELLRQPEDDARTSEEPSQSPSRSLSPPADLVPKRKRRSGPGTKARLPKEKKPSPAPEPTVVTPRILDLCRDLYPLNDFLAVGPDTQERIELSPDERRKHPIHKDNATSIEWVRSSRTIPYHYNAVLIDGVRYDVGDTIMVEPGEDENKKRAQAINIQSKNPMAKSKWFAKICYMFQVEDTNDKRAHVQWYSHGAELILRETAPDYGLYLLDECMDISLDSVYQKCNLRVLKPTEDEPIVGPKDNIYFTGVHWDPINSVFFERKPAEEARALAACKHGRRCVSCGMGLIQGELEEWHLENGELRNRGVSYHVNDFVYIRPQQQETDVYIIAQIVDITPSQDVVQEYHTIDVRVYQRRDLITRKAAAFGEEAMDERCLFRSDVYSDKVDVRFVDGKAFVIHRDSLSPSELEAWCASDDHFYVEAQAREDVHVSLDDLRPLSTRSFTTCNDCVRERRKAVKEQARLKEAHEPLRGLELFAGAGGLSTGFDESGFVKTLWAVELGASACLTYQENHPYAKVYNGSVNTVLQHAIETHERKRPKPLYSELGEKLPLMPKPGDVDFIYGGPPCQGFSRMNHTKTIDDYRNTLVCNMLSYVDFYRPKFFMLENVEGILYHPLAATQEGGPGSKMEGGIRMGVVKLILRVLTNLGYQASFKLLQAGQYGAPQSRLRVIFLGAKRDITLPMFPIPTHCTADDVMQIKLETGNLLRPAVRVIPTDDKEIETRQAWLQFAPFLRVSVEDAISDLPKFDWRDPVNEDIFETAHRKSLGIKTFDAVTNKDEDASPYAGYVDPEPYVSEPLSRYQMWMRQEVDPDDGVLYQYTQRYGAGIVERTVNVPLKEDANHVDLPVHLRNPVHFIGGNIHGKSKSSYISIYARVLGKWHFQTALTSAQPNAKGGRLVHPTQKRVLTVREFARAQGFPDHYKFLSLSRNACPDQIRQIGNAVPVPLALALGKSIGNVLAETWKEEDAADDDGREESPEIPMIVD